MFKTLLVFNNYELYEQMRTLPVWGGKYDFEISDFVRDGSSAYERLRAFSFDLVISEIRMTGLDGLQLLRRVRDEDLCRHFVLCSEFPDFHYARQGIIMGAFDYFVKPFEEGLLLDLFERIRQESRVHERDDLLKLDHVKQLIQSHDTGVEQAVLARLKEIYAQHGDTLEADKDVHLLYETVVDGMFLYHDWLEMYLEKDVFYAVHNISENDESTYRQYYRMQLKQLFEEFNLLFPKTEDAQLEKIILYMLHHPEEDLKQSTLAKKMYVNSSYLSTIFVAKTAQRYVDYMSHLKLKRAGVLLRTTDVKVAALAEMLGYRDIAYFTKLFKKQYHMTPTEYRMTEGYDFVI